MGYWLCKQLLEKLSGLVVLSRGNGIVGTRRSWIEV
jgi:hypothetical protein